MKCRGIVYYGKKAIIYLRENGIFISVEHLIEKLIWIYSKKKFAKVGKNTFVRWRYEFHGQENIYIGDRFNAQKRFQCSTFSVHNDVVFSPKIVIGNDVSINYDVHMSSINEIRIDDGVLIASKVFITDHYHGEINQKSIKILPQKRILYSKGPVHIKKNVWIGEGVCVMPGVTIGENSIVGCNSVVTKNIPDCCVAAGTPAVIIKKF